MFTVHRRLPMLLALVAVLFFSAPLVAQDRDDYSRRPRSNEAQYRAYDNGYQRGEDKGRDDAKDGRAFDYARQKDYRKADDGYKDRYGSRAWYADEYRRGFIAGYTSGYRAYAPRGFYYNRDYGYGSPRYEGRAVPRPYSPYDARVNGGYNKGYSDGFEKGRDDLRHDRRYDPQRHDWYRDGDRGYHREYGPRGDYAAAYRQGFLNGYSVGYGERRR